LTIRANTPIGDISLVDLIAGVAHRLQAGRLPNGTVDVCDLSAAAAHQVMVVVADASLVSGRAARRFYPLQQARRRESVQGLVDGLGGDVTHPVAHSGGDGLDPEVVARSHGLDDREPGGGDPKTHTAQLFGRVGRRRSRVPGHPVNLLA
jgi:hypothetical protein